MAPRPLQVLATLCALPAAAALGYDDDVVATDTTLTAARRWVQSNVTCLEWNLDDKHLRSTVESTEVDSLPSCLARCEDTSGCLSVHWFESSSGCFLFNDSCVLNETSNPIADWMTKLVGNNSAWKRVEIESPELVDDDGFARRVMDPHLARLFRYAPSVADALPLYIVIFVLLGVVLCMVSRRRPLDPPCLLLDGSTPASPCGAWAALSRALCSRGPRYTPLPESAPCTPCGVAAPAAVPAASAEMVAFRPITVDADDDGGPPERMRTAVTGRTTTAPPESWQRVRQLGHGSFGEVYLVMCGDGSLLAVKVVTLARDLTPTQLSTVARETEVLASLDHPAVVRSLGCRYDPSAGHLNLFMPYMPGGSLGQLVRHLPATLQEVTAVGYLRQVLRGLAYIHGRGLIHCDVKGDNILLDATGEAKLADFGAAAYLHEILPGDPSAVAEPTARAIGTPLWMAPEVISGRTRHTAKSDVWAVGILAVELLNHGATPWGAFDNAMQAMRVISRWEDPLPGPAMPQTFSPACYAFLTACHRPTPHDRPDAAGLLQQPWITDGSAAPVAPCRTPPPVIESVQDLHRAYTTRQRAPPSSYNTIATVSSPQTHPSTGWYAGGEGPRTVTPIDTSLEAT